MVTVVESENVWRWPKAAAVSVFVAGTSVLGICLVDQMNEAMEYEMPDWAFAPLSLGAALVYPMSVMFVSYKRMFRLGTVLAFITAYAVGWELVMFCSQTIEFGAWKGLRPEERTFLKLLGREGIHLAMTLGIASVIGMLTWSVCRLVRGKPLIQDGTICGRCGYSLIGNVSGRCPECGTPRLVRGTTADANRVPVWLSASLVLLVACVGWAAFEHRLTPWTKARSYAERWTRIRTGILPNADECRFFSENLNDTRSVLSDCLRHPKHEVRMRAAYVIEKIGSSGRALSSPLVEALQREQEPIVRIYILNALRSFRDSSNDVLSAIRERLDASSGTEERIYTAAALYVLSDSPDEREDADAFVCTFLRPYEVGRSEFSAEEYADLRWSAVNAVEYMLGTTKAIPLLEAMLEEPNSKPWVRAHVPRALDTLREGGR